MNRVVRLGVSVCGAIVLGACSGGSPSSPSTVPNGSASISGTAVVGTGGVGSGQRLSLAAPTVGGLAAVPPGLQVCVVGTDVCVDVTETGVFELTIDVAGDVDLHFSGAGQDVVVTVNDVQAGELIIVSVSLHGNRGTLRVESRQPRSERRVTLCHVTGNGRYRSIEVDINAEAAHRRHGDGAPGEAVPTDPDLAFGPDCELLGPAVDLEKATNGYDADYAPGPAIAVGAPVTWTYRVVNVGTVGLSNVVVMDSVEGAVDCPMTTLQPGESMTCVVNGTAAVGEYSNVGTVTANADGDAVGDVDESHYRGETETDDGEDRGEKVTVCHIRGNGTYHQIEVSSDALPAHLAHGDVLPENGGCPEPAS